MSPQIFSIISSCPVSAWPFIWRFTHCYQPDNKSETCAIKLVKDATQVFKISFIYSRSPNTSDGKATGNKKSSERSV